MPFVPDKEQSKISGMFVPDKVDNVAGSSSKEPTGVERIAASVPVRFAFGAAEPFLAAGETAGIPGLKEKVSQFKEMQKAGSGKGDILGGLNDSPPYFLKSEIPSGAYETTSDVAGTVASPLNLAAAKALPLYRGAEGAVSRIVQAIKNAAVGATAGGASGALTTGEGKLDRAQTGAAIGAAAPVAIAAASKAADFVGGTVNSLLSLITKSGKVSLGHRMAIDQLPAKQREEILKAIDDANIPMETPLGAKQTVADILAARRASSTDKSVAGARIAAAEDYLEKEVGGEAIAKQRAAREAIIREQVARLGGVKGQPVDAMRMVTPEDAAIQSLKAERQATVQPMYRSAGKQVVSGDDALDSILDRPAVATALGRAEKSAANAERATVVSGARPVDSLMNAPKQFEKYTVESLGDQYKLLSQRESALQKAAVKDPRLQFEANDVSNARKALGEWLSEKSPEWAQANRIFGFKSDPINSAKVGQALGREIVSPVGEITPAKFLAATDTLADQSRMIQSETGRPGKTLDNIFNLGDASRVAGLREEAKQIAEKSALANRARVDLKDEAPFQFPMLLRWEATVANKLLRDASRVGKTDVVEAATEALRDPELYKKLILGQIEKGSSKGKIIDELIRYGRIPAASAFNKGE